MNEDITNVIESYKDQLIENYFKVGEENILFYPIWPVHYPTRGHMNDKEIDAGIDFYIPYFNLGWFEKLILSNPDRSILYKLTKLEYTDLNELINLYPEWEEEFKANPYKLIITINPQERIRIPSGIKSIFPPSLKNTYLDAENKSGIADSLGLVVGSKVIDSNYLGEINLSLINTTNKPVVVTTGMKVVQFIHKPLIPSKPTIINEEIFNILSTTNQSTRNDGGFSSTGLY